MIKSTKAPIPNAIIFVTDPVVSDTPREMSRPVVATETCVVVATQHLIDGDTEISLTDATEPVPSDMACVFESTLKTASQRVVVLSIAFEAGKDFDELLSLDVSSPTVRVRVWTHDPDYPDRVFIEVSETQSVQVTPRSTP